jgi:UPF0042 nucleotide-binding protein
MKLGEKKEFIFLTGLSGAGKTTALKAFEDLGFYCIDNLPPKLLHTFVELCDKSTEEIHRVAIGIDIREREFLKDFPEEYAKITKLPHNFQLLFFEASDEVLVRRFIETRRPHPLAFDKPIIQGIAEERKKLIEIKDLCDKIIDTTNYNIHQLRNLIIQLFQKSSLKSQMFISIISFGYKYGIPFDTDLLFDVRFLPNPYFVVELKELPGTDEKVKTFIMNNDITNKFIKLWKQLILFLVEQYQQEGKKYLTISIGCTGGKHRSVCIAEWLYALLKKRKYQVEIVHRDANKI